MATSPLLPDGARAVILSPGAQPVMLTEYAPGSAPVTIVNTGSDRVWLAGNSSVSASSGVPLDGGTSVPWQSAGQIWAVLDQAATDPVTLYVSSAISSWTPSPVSVAAATATQLLATGVPSVDASDVLLNDQEGYLLPAGQPLSIQILGINKYQSLQLIIVDPMSKGQIHHVTLNWGIGDGKNSFSVFDTENFTIEDQGHPTSPIPPGFCIYRTSSKHQDLQIQVAAVAQDSAIVLAVTGSYRAISRPSYNMRTPMMYNNSLPNASFFGQGSDGIVAMVMNSPAAGSYYWYINSINGPAQITADCSGTVQLGLVHAPSGIPISEFKTITATAPLSIDVILPSAPLYLYAGVGSGVGQLRCAITMTPS